MINRHGVDDDERGEIVDDGAEQARKEAEVRMAAEPRPRRPDDDAADESGDRRDGREDRDIVGEQIARVARFRLDRPPFGLRPQDDGFRAFDNVQAGLPALA